MAKELSLPDYFTHYTPFPKVLEQCEMQIALSRLWTRVVVSISYGIKGPETYTSFVL